MTAYTAINSAELPQFNGSFWASAWDTWYSYSERACNDTATVYRWYVATFFSAKAQTRYQWIGEMLGCMIALAVLYTQRWAESEVQSCLATESTEAPQPVAQAAMAAAIAPAVATLVVKVEAPKPVTSAELRRQCQSAGIRWRNAHGKGRHLSKGEMIAALA